MNTKEIVELFNRVSVFFKGNIDSISFKETIEHFVVFVNTNVANINLSDVTINIFNIEKITVLENRTTFFFRIEGFFDEEEELEEEEELKEIEEPLEL